MKKEYYLYVNGQKVKVSEETVCLLSKLHEAKNHMGVDVGDKA